MQDFVSENYYDILGVDRSAPFDVIKKAYRKKVINCHPDHHPGDKRAEEQFKKVSIAYKILQDPEKRRHYDVVSSTLGGSISNNPVINDFVNAFKHIINDVTDDFNQEFKVKKPTKRRPERPAPKKSDGHIHLKQGGVSFKIKRA